MRQLSDAVPESARIMVTLVAARVVTRGNLPHVVLCVRRSHCTLRSAKTAQVRKDVLCKWRAREKLTLQPPVVRAVFPCAASTRRGAAIRQAGFSCCALSGGWRLPRRPSRAGADSPACGPVCCGGEGCPTAISGEAAVSAAGTAVVASTSRSAVTSSSRVTSGPFGQHCSCVCIRCGAQS